jgi:GNAT superfamily N-acetyltransferase
MRRQHRDAMRDVPPRSTVRAGTAPVEIAPLRDEQEESVASLLARAFLADPIFVHVEPDPAARGEFLRRFMASLVRRSHRLAVAMTTSPELLGVSLWKGPDLRTLSPAQLAMTGLGRIAEWLSPAAHERFERVFGAVDRALDEDVPEPCWYLGVLGVAPEAQGQGLGSRLMAPGLARADHEGLPVTLETSLPRNLPLYRRHGFAVLRELPPAVTGGPVVWTMKRPPQPAG